MDISIYEMLKVNRKNKKPIKDLLAKCRDMRNAMDEYENKWHRLKLELNVKPKTTKYKASDPKDKIDVMFMDALNRLNFTGLRITRLDTGKYMFGTKKIIAKIINGKLVIRVGGGYMSVDEFIEQYGRMELMKMIAHEEADKGL